MNLKFLIIYILFAISNSVYSNFLSSVSKENYVLFYENENNSYTDKDLDQLLHNWSPRINAIEANAEIFSPSSFEKGQDYFEDAVKLFKNKKNEEEANRNLDSDGKIILR